MPDSGIIFHVVSCHTHIDPHFPPHSPDQATLVHQTAWQGTMMGMMAQQMGIAAVNDKVLRLTNAAIAQVCIGATACVWGKGSMEGGRCPGQRCSLRVGRSLKAHGGTFDSHTVIQGAVDTRCEQVHTRLYLRSFHGNPAGPVISTQIVCPMFMTFYTFCPSDQLGPRGQPCQQRRAQVGTTLSIAVPHTLP